MARDDGTAARPRCDGVYACPVTGSSGDPGWNYPRFHRGGRVTVAWAASAPDAIAPYLTPERDELDQGYLTFDEPVFGFSTASRHGHQLTWGLIARGSPVQTVVCRQLDKAAMQPAP